MATVKVKFRPSSIDGRPGTIVYFVTHRRIVRQITTGYKVFPCEWDEKTSKLIVPDKGRTNTIKDIARRIHRDINRLEKIVESLKNNGDEFSTDTIVGLFHEADKGESFFSFMEEVILRLKRLCKERTAENYTTALNSFRRFRGGEDISLDEMDSDLMAEYEAYLKSHGITMNSVSFYNRILRAVYNRAVEKPAPPPACRKKRTHVKSSRLSAAVSMLSCIDPFSLVSGFTSIAAFFPAVRAEYLP